jgi:hypothetical protein
MRKMQLSTWRVRGVLLLMILGLVGCGGNQSYEETFDEPGTWRTDSNADVQGEVREGVYDFEVLADDLHFWTSPGLQFSDGFFEVEATQVEGPDNNAFGMLFRMDDENNNFYSFQISGDGYVWIGLYEDGIQANEALVNGWWFESTAIRPGSGVKNKLGVRAEGDNMIFYVNDIEVGRISDDTHASGDIGLIVRSLGIGGVHVQFDNFTVTPLDN